MNVYILRQKRTNCLDGRWMAVGTVGGYDNLAAARMAAEEYELKTGHRVGIDSVDETGKVHCVYGPEQTFDYVTEQTGMTADERGWIG